MAPLTASQARAARRISAVCWHTRSNRPEQRSTAAELESTVVTAVGKNLRDCFGPHVQISDFLGVSAIGVRVSGIDLSRELTRAQVDAISQAIGAYKIVCFSGQDIDNVSKLRRTTVAAPACLCGSCLLGLTIPCVYVYAELQLGALREVRKLSGRRHTTHDELRHWFAARSNSSVSRPTMRESTLRVRVSLFHSFRHVQIR